MTSAKDIAQWMLEKLAQDKILYQETLVYEISAKYGESYTYINENGNLAIDRHILKEFKTLTETTVVWDRGERCWRYRANYDDPKKRQVE